MSAIVAIATDPDLRADLARALGRRYGQDFTVIITDQAGAAAAAAEHDTIAVALARIGTDDFEALGTLGGAHPEARRIAVVGVGDTSVADQLGRALTLGHVDSYVGHPWASADEELHPMVTEALRGFAGDQRLRYEKVSVVDVDRTGPGAELVSWLNRNGVASRLHVAGSAEAGELVAGPLAGRALPAVALFDGRVLEDPTPVELVEALGARTTPSKERYDVTIIGAGPGGLAAAVYSASEGLDACVIEKVNVGGQAGASAKIRNYLGFRWGIRGVDLATEASSQAEQLGAEFVLAHDATAIEADGDELVVRLSSGAEVRSSAVIVAGGVTYRRLGVSSVDLLIGRGVFYGAAAGEAAAMAGLKVVVLGGGNSAGQAAAHLAAAGADVIVGIRGDDLGKSMSDYLVQQLAGTAGVHIRFNTQVSGAVGDDHLEGLVFTDTVTGETEQVPVDALFVFIGASPHTEWLQGVVDLDDRGYVVTGVEGARWLETSMPGVYGVGDIRSGSIKRVAAAVGEGSTAAMLARERIEDLRD